MDVDVLNESGTDVDVVELTRLSRFVMARLRLHPSTQLCVRLVDEETMASLNSRWMHATGPTDVLAFPMDELEPPRAGQEPEEGCLGDLAVCPQVAQAQADERSQDPVEELRLLTVHGILHLLGYDHGEPEEQNTMFALQARLIAEWQGVRRGQHVDDPPHPLGGGRP